MVVAGRNDRGPGGLSIVWGEGGWSWPPPGRGPGSADAGRPVRLVWAKRIWRCVEPLCTTATWTEQNAEVGSRASLTRRARIEICRRVGQDADSVAQVAREFGIGWHTAMAAVREHGERLVEDPQRLGAPSALGLDETSFLRAGPKHPTVIIGFVDLDRHKLLDVAEGRSGQVVRDWLDDRPAESVARVDVAVIDPFRGYATGLTDRLDATRRSSLITSTRSDWRTRRSTMPAVTCNKSRSVIVVGATIRCIGSAAASSSVTNVSATNNTNGSSRCWVTATATVTSPTPTSPRSSCATSTTRARSVPRVAGCEPSTTTVTKPGCANADDSRAPSAPGSRSARLPHDRSFERADRRDQLADQEGQTRRSRLPQLQQLPATTPVALRRHLAHCPHHKSARPSTTLHRVEPQMLE